MVLHLSPRDPPEDLKVPLEDLVGLNRREYMTLLLDPNEFLEDLVSVHSPREVTALLFSLGDPPVGSVLALISQGDMALRHNRRALQWDLVIDCYRRKDLAHNELLQSVNQRYVCQESMWYLSRQHLAAGGCRSSPVGSDGTGKATDPDTSPEITVAKETKQGPLSRFQLGVVSHVK